MAETFPPDRFDDVPDLKRVGAHRAPAPKGRGWIAFLWAVVAVLVLVGIGTVALFTLNNKVDFFPQPTNSASESETPTPTPTEAAPVVDTEANILVLNGTETAGLAGQASEALAAAGFTQAISTSDASTSDVAQSGIYYQDPSQEGAARAMSAALGGMKIELSQQYAIPAEEGETPLLRIVVVLGADYTPAG
ncbi:LytR C-terminal domain-containing protein [Plantibacter sp. YIM 135347]|uniref:LytR C-terminal domain-containing protein n=1 Tax=Plantibacter sp. YIM 135347 TaxID=3423919 RepID=UPI003D33C460